jgi:hypothetical protein
MEFGGLDLMLGSKSVHGKAHFTIIFSVKTQL